MAAILATLATSTDGAQRSADVLLGRMKHRGARRDVRCADGVLLGALFDDDGGCWFGETIWVAADARVDNRDELLGKLGLPPETSDAELLGRAHEHWGGHWPERVLGDFAVAIWDPRKRELTLARDPLGVRCLYWTHDRHGTRCATEMLPLVRTRAHVELDPVQMALYLANSYDEREDTLVRGVRAVPPAHIVVVGDDGEKRRRRYWFPVATVPAASTKAECSEELRLRLDDAVRVRVRTTDPVIAAEVSGGFDSSSVAALAAAALRGEACTPKLHAVTTVYPGLATDESAYSRALAQHLGVPLLEVDPFAAPELLEPSFAPHARGDVYFHPTLANKWLQLRETRSIGARVILTGFASDQLAHRVPTAEATDAIRRADLPGIFEAFRSPQLFARAAADVVLGSRVSRTLAREFLGRRGPLSAQFAREVDAVVDARKQQLRGLPCRDEVQLSLVYAVEHSISVSLAMLDRMAALEGCSFRHPFLDRRLVESVLAMPHELTAGRGRTFRKPLLRHAMRDHLPREILDRRTKTTFDSFVHRVMDERAAEFAHLLKDGAVVSARLVDDRTVKCAVENPLASLRLFVDWVGLEVWARSLHSFGEDHERYA
jgi:asparagine synthase (glutamine-hydrolysing)